MTRWLLPLPRRAMPGGRSSASLDSIRMIEAGGMTAGDDEQAPVAAPPAASPPKVAVEPPDRSDGLALRDAASAVWLLAQLMHSIIPFRTTTAERLEAWAWRQWEEGGASSTMPIQVPEVSAAAVWADLERPFIVRGLLDGAAALENRSWLRTPPVGELLVPYYSDASGGALRPDAVGTVARVVAAIEADGHDGLRRMCVDPLMLQRGVDLATLDTSYVSSLSWYFLLMFGLRGFLRVVLGEDPDAMDANREMQMQMGMGMGGGGPQGFDAAPAYKHEKEELQMAQHAWVLEDAELQLCGAAVAARVQNAALGARPVKKAGARVKKVRRVKK